MAAYRTLVLRKEKPPNGGPQYSKPGNPTVNNDVSSRNGGKLASVDVPKPVNERLIFPFATEEIGDFRILILLSGDKVKK